MGEAKRRGSREQRVLEGRTRLAGEYEEYLVRMAEEKERRRIARKNRTPEQKAKDERNEDLIEAVFRARADAAYRRGILRR